ncbi:hypothetical protein CGMCC3_g9173 [Colletotrichum fructicola]|uniref:Uncharacterized protein n=1 Tax=Colletotrichum fructicola (strain Nara gc5) TaxID=1213859 RepID=A0A7J6JND7_COLFN|nr:uncharacterized protein CGMCC3_g9173 [Colletotrichum fructicola]KAE9574677.1 hypothetical protein CGMCC3_g9173 [Colletotrichum fructicola]KAF4432834.1 hypothetical protein CFRS1_v008002 [Colletotrichum fructicola]KAF4492244.1 hypothetical protein CGGC5_v000235 [Colletotrichum fructicola Nara gc5]
MRCHTNCSISGTSQVEGTERVAIQSRRFDAIASRNSHRTAIFMGSIRQRAAGLRVRRIFRSRTDQLTSIINPIFFACAPS